MLLRDMTICCCTILWYAHNIPSWWNCSDFCMWIMLLLRASSKLISLFLRTITWEWVTLVTVVPVHPVLTGMFPRALVAVAVLGLKQLCSDAYEILLDACCSFRVAYLCFLMDSLSLVWYQILIFMVDPVGLIFFSLGLIYKELYGFLRCLHLDSVAKYFPEASELLVLLIINTVQKTRLVLPCSVSENETFMFCLFVFYVVFFFRIFKQFLRIFVKCVVLFTLNLNSVDAEHSLIISIS